ncbi:MAG: glycosyltransferase family 39 protein [Lentisphaeria bacterium]|nr:glycosyltransferase family 39 protein [Lentisphaeria bacterium]
MKSAVVILACDAVSRGVWNEALDAVSHQDFRPDARIVIDSGSADGTAEAASARGWRVVPVRRRNFDHGLTRSRVVRFLYRHGFDTVIFLSQDVVLASPRSLGFLAEFLHAHPVAGCYGRQTGRKGGFDARQRACFYPAVSRVKTLADAPELKTMTPFFSNAFSAWKTAEVVRLGGFPRTMFGEDMLLAARVIASGGAVGYCAEAEAIHEHPETLRALFLRGLAVGRFHREHPELRRLFGRGGTPLSLRDVSAAPLAFSVKTLGWAAGRIGDAAVPWTVFFLLWLLLIPALLLYDFPLRDVADRYAPMAKSFAAGAWRFAFHPRVPPLLPVLAGAIVRLLGCGGAAACQLAGALFFTCGVFPLWSACRKIYGRTAALWTVLLYAGCAGLFRLGYYGTRESCGVFGVILLMYAAAELKTRPERSRGYAVFAAAEAILLLSRGDLAAFALAAFAALFVYDWIVHRRCLRSLGAGIAILLLVSPVLVYNYRMIGYPVPEIRHVPVFLAVCRRAPVLYHLRNPRPQFEEKEIAVFLSPPRQTPVPHGGGGK